MAEAGEHHWKEMKIPSYERFKSYMDYIVTNNYEDKNIIYPKAKYLFDWLKKNEGYYAGKDDFTWYQVYDFIANTINLNPSATAVELDNYIASRIPQVEEDARLNGMTNAQADAYWRKKYGAAYVPNGFYGGRRIKRSRRRRSAKHRRSAKRA
jgi:hypothetical protein